jgi:antitoxin CcdA
MNRPRKTSRTAAEVALEQKLEQQARELWFAKNRAGMEAYNQQVEKHGVFSDGLRAF